MLQADGIEEKEAKNKGDGRVKSPKTKDRGKGWVHIPQWGII